MGSTYIHSQLKTNILDLFLSVAAIGKLEFDLIQRPVLGRKLKPNLKFLDKIKQKLPQ